VTTARASAKKAKLHLLAGRLDEAIDAGKKALEKDKENLIALDALELLSQVY
jgi:hypothetical protein